MVVPQYANNVMKKIKESGFEAYFVGGCVRDALLGALPKDYDIASSASPEKIKELFGDCTLVTAGEKHGTIGVVSGGHVVEVTTYRSDGEYKDHRRPESVAFGTSICEDLKRRDFTINAVCFDGKYLDPFGGAEDIKRGIIRTVGDPDRRFEEDALRILRALRFASRLGFHMEESTASSIHEKKDLLKSISVERIFSEFKKILVGDFAENVLLEYPDVIGVFIPEILPTVGFDQRSRYHVYDIYTHIVKTVSYSPKTELLRLTAFFHDIAKPLCFTVDEKGGHFKGHPKLGASLTDEILKRLKCDTKTRETVVRLVREHDEDLDPDEVSVKRFLRKNGEEYFDLYIAIRRADNLAHAEFTHKFQRTLDLLAELKEKITARGDVVSRSQLKIKGGDLKAMGFEGRKIGETLELLLNAAIEGRVPNERDALLNFARDPSNH